MAWLFPREHGAYGQLAFPLVAAIASGTPTPAALLLSLAFFAAFVAHEPVLILTGQRGTRARRDLEGDAVKTLVWAGATALFDVAIAVALMPAGLRWTVLVPAAFALAALPMIVQRAQKSAFGEMHVALTLGSCALPAGVAAGLRPQEAAGCWFIMTLGFWAATLAVRATIALQRREPSVLARVAAAALAIGSPLLAMLMSDRFLLHPLLWSATLPLSTLALVFAATPPSARKLRSVGWSLVGASAAATILLTALNRV
ncbi:MAG TPA: YwiC-like family protein [Vicinamibacterales bacterium]|nr:YwiC-like family protein [Vicinamibacterales bacterium]